MTIQKPRVFLSVVTTREKRTFFYIRSITCVIERPVAVVARAMNLCFSDVGGKKVCSKHFILLIAVTIFICVAYLYFCLVLVE